MIDSSTPVLVGVGQLTQRWQDPASQKHPMALMADAARAAFEDCGATGIIAGVDSLHVVNTFTWPYDDLPGQLAAELGVPATHREYTGIGGNTPQRLVNHACAELASGRRRAVLIVGAEALDSTMHAASAGIDLPWPAPAGTTPSPATGNVDEERDGVGPMEKAHGLVLPIHVYPLLETALRADARRSPADHQAHVGRLFARLSQVAATHAQAWFPTVRSADEIATPTADNRYICYPYTKLMNAIMRVDQAAALLLTTVDEAERLGIDPDRWVFPMGGADLNDIWDLARRASLIESPALQTAASTALAQAGVGIDEVDVFDLYSCFPSAVQIARRALGIAEDDGRELTVTGGLPYFGGAGNNYGSHAIATVAQRVRSRPATLAMVTGMGWYVTKHAVGVYGKRPPAQRWTDRDTTAAQAAIEAAAMPPPVERADGRLTIEAFTIRHERDGTPSRGTAIGRLADGRRALAVIDAGPAELELLEREELVGRTGTVHHDESSERNILKM